MCGSCWACVPAPLQRAVYRAYVPGKRPSREWLEAANAARRAVQGRAS